ncbi:MAG: prepilin-type N-terminal cleavage/methylation domain-containing protein [Candidatus Omnitrophota bacterium]|jgi:prepilin-type N-terminal cleavage/methylation domain-containing protein
MVKELITKDTFRESKLREIRHSGFTLIEILISLILIAIGIFFCTKIFIAGKYFMKESENKSRAMEIADMHMNEYLAKSYADLFVLPVAGAKNKTTVASGVAGTNNFFSWQVNVSDKAIPKVGTTYDIPYEEIEVICSYKEENVNGTTLTKDIRLVNMVPYPRMHIFSQAFSPDVEVLCYGPKTTCSAPSPVACCSTVPSASYGSVFNLDFSLKVRSDLLLFYNISTDIVDKDNNIGSGDLIFSKCFIIDKSSKAATL